MNWKALRELSDSCLSLQIHFLLFSILLSMLQLYCLLLIPQTHWIIPVTRYFYLWFKLFWNLVNMAGSYVSFKYQCKYYFLTEACSDHSIQAFTFVSKMHKDSQNSVIYKQKSN